MMGYLELLGPILYYFRILVDIRHSAYNGQYKALVAASAILMAEVVFPFRISFPDPHSPRPETSLTWFTVPII